MKAAWYERPGPARDVLVVGQMDGPQPLAGEVRIRIAASGVNPGDVKKREDAFGIGMSYPRIIPHSDGAGTVDRVGLGVSQEWLGQRVWCYDAQSYRPFGTAAEYAVVPLRQAISLPEGVSMEQDACLGILGITAHRAVHVAGSVDGRTVLVQGGAGAVGACGVQLAHRAGARVIATCRSESDMEIASPGRCRSSPAKRRQRNGTYPSLSSQWHRPYRRGGVCSQYQCRRRDAGTRRLNCNLRLECSQAGILVWQLVFKNARMFFIGSDDVPEEAKLEATRDINAALESGWRGLQIAARFSLDNVAAAHERVEHPIGPGRTIVTT